MVRPPPADDARPTDSPPSTPAPREAWNPALHGAASQVKPDEIAVFTIQTRSDIGDFTWFTFVLWGP